MSDGAQVLTGRANDRDTVTLVGSDGRLEATFLPGLGMVGSSLKFRGVELLAQRGGPEAYAERGSTFGIPLLYPWANRLGAWEYEIDGHSITLAEDSAVVRADPDTGLPIHGALAACPDWHVTQTGSDAGEAWLYADLDFGSQQRLLEVFPFPHTLRLRVLVRDTELSLSLTVTPTGSDPVPVSFGFHPYLALAGQGREGWEIVLPVLRRVILDERNLPSGDYEDLEEGELDGELGERTFDDSFDRLVSDRPPVFAVADNQLRITVEFSKGYSVAQVYAPTDSQFIAFEPMTAPVDALRTGQDLRFVKPGEQFSAEFVIAVDEETEGPGLEVPADEQLRAPLDL